MATNTETADVDPGDFKHVGDGDETAGYYEACIMAHIQETFAPDAVFYSASMGRIFVRFWHEEAVPTAFFTYVAGKNGASLELADADDTYETATFMIEVF